MSQSYEKKLEAQRVEEAALLVRVVFARDADALHTLLNYTLWKEDYDIHVQDGVKKGVRIQVSDDELEALQERADRGDEEARSTLEKHYFEENRRKREERERALRAAGADLETPGAW